MKAWIKSAGLALASAIPLFASPACAASQTEATNGVNTSNKAANNATQNTATQNTRATIAFDPSTIIYQSADKPTTVDSVDLKQYTGKWYEIGRLPLYFQRDCAGDVTATYTKNTDGEGITVLNQCTGADGTLMSVEGLAKPADDTGSKLKVTFIPSWIRWLPIGRADYWVLARDPNYQTALVGTPDRDYLWLLARSPNISQELYAKYRKIAQEQGYNLKEFKLTDQKNQTVNLVP